MNLRSNHRLLLERARESDDALQRFLIPVNGVAIAAILNIAGLIKVDGGEVPGCYVLATLFFLISLGCSGISLWLSMLRKRAGIRLYEELIEKDPNPYNASKISKSAIENHQKTTAKQYAYCGFVFQVVASISLLIGMFTILVILFSLTH